MQNRSEISVDPTEMTDFALERAQEEAKASSLLEKIGYLRSTYTSPVWSQFVEMTSHCLFLYDKSHYQKDGVVTEHTLLHKLQFSTQHQAQLFLDALRRSNPSIEIHASYQPVESLDDYEVLLKHRVLMVPEDVARVSCEIFDVAKNFAGRGYHWYPTTEDETEPSNDPVSFSEWPHRPRRTMRMRCEFQGDAVLARLVLAPWICRWTDVDGQSHMSNGAEPSAGSLYGQEVEFETATDDVTLDELRWLLNQIADMHVAAESLNYADKYTGDRMDFEYLERITPSDETLGKFMPILARLRAFAASTKSRFDTMCATLEVPDDESDDLDEAELTG